METQSSTASVRHAQAEIESLKRQWRDDPCWTLAETPGFGMHHDELAAYETAYWAEARQALRQQEQADRQAQPAVNMLPCVQIYGGSDQKRRVAWINPSTISYFTEYVPWRDENQPRLRWTLLSMVNGEQIQVDASPEQFAGWLRGDRPQEGTRWADLQSETEAIDGDQVV